MPLGAVHKRHLHSAVILFRTRREGFWIQNSIFCWKKLIDSLQFCSFVCQVSSGDSEVIFAILESSCHLLLPV